MPAPPLPRIPSTRPRHPNSTTNTLLTRTSVEAFLLAFGDNDYPLPETVRCLDEMITDYMIETCHEAASVAHHARRAKIKLDDFKFMLRRDTVKLGRVSDMLETDKELKRKRKAFDTDEGAVLGRGEREGEGERERENEDDGVEGVGGKKDSDGREAEAEKKKKKKKKKKEKKDKVDGGGGGDDETVKSA